MWYSGLPGYIIPAQFLRIYLIINCRILHITTAHNFNYPIAGINVYNRQTIISLSIFDDILKKKVQATTYMKLGRLDIKVLTLKNDRVKLNFQMDFKAGFYETHL